MKNKVSVILIVLGGLLVFGCEKDVIVEHPPAVIFGTVTDSVSNSVVESVWITWDSTVDTANANLESTDSLGRYRMVSMSENGWIYCTKPGYHQLSIEYNATRGESTFLPLSLVPDSL